MRIGFIGLGNVGGKLANNLLNNQFDVIVLDKDTNITDEFESNGCKVSKSIKDIVENNEEDYLSKIGVSIFEIGSANRFLSKVYVKLYKELIKAYPVMKNVCVSNFDSFSSLFETFEYCDAKELSLIHI